MLSSVSVQNELLHIYSVQLIFICLGIGLSVE